MSFEEYQFQEKFNSIDDKFKKIDSQFSEIKTSFDTQFLDIKSSVSRIENALVGKIDENQVGFLEKVRNHETKITEQEKTINQHSEKIEDLEDFKKKIKTIVAVSFAVIPALWEVFKLVSSAAWDFIFHKGTH